MRDSDASVKTPKHLKLCAFLCLKGNKYTDGLYFLIIENAESFKSSTFARLGEGKEKGRATHMGNTLVQLHRLHFCA